MTASPSIVLITAAMILGLAASAAGQSFGDIIKDALGDGDQLVAVAASGNGTMFAVGRTAMVTADANSGVLLRNSTLAFPPGGLIGPVTIACDAGGTNVFVTMRGDGDVNSPTIFHISRTPTGNYADVGKSPFANGPERSVFTRETIAFASSDDGSTQYLVTEGSQSCIQRMTMEIIGTGASSLNASWEVFDGNCRGGGRYTRITALAVDREGRIWVVDAGNLIVVYPPGTSGNQRPLSMTTGGFDGLHAFSMLKSPYPQELLGLYTTEGGALATLGIMTSKAINDELAFPSINEIEVRNYGNAVVNGSMLVDGTFVIDGFTAGFEGAFFIFEPTTGNNSTERMAFTIPYRANYSGSELTFIGPGAENPPTDSSGAVPGTSSPITEPTSDLLPVPSATSTPTGAPTSEPSSSVAPAEEHRNNTVVVVAIIIVVVVVILAAAVIMVMKTKYQSKPSESGEVEGVRNDLDGRPRETEHEMSPVVTNGSPSTPPVELPGAYHSHQQQQQQQGEQPKPQPKIRRVQLPNSTAQPQSNEGRRFPLPKTPLASQADSGSPGTPPASPPSSAGNQLLTLVSGDGNENDEPNPNSNPIFLAPMFVGTRPPLSASMIDDEHGIKFKRGKLLGRGAFGAVYVGLDENTGRVVAAKEVVMPTSLQPQQTKKLMRTMRREINVMRQLKHRNIVEYYGADFVDDCFYILMEYVPGGSLRSMLEDYGSLKPKLVATYTRQIVAALAYMHSMEIIHRDVKTLNILVSLDTTVKLADFGSSRNFETVSGIQGTYLWMAPEIHRGEHATWSSDIWSLGCTVMEMLTAELPFHHISPNFKKVVAMLSNKKGVSANFRALPPRPTGSAADEKTDDAWNFLEKCLSTDPLKRPSAAELLKHPFIADLQDPESVIVSMETANETTGSVPRADRPAVPSPHAVPLDLSGVQSNLSMTLGKEHEASIRNKVFEDLKEAEEGGDHLGLMVSQVIRGHLAKSGMGDENSFEVFNGSQQEQEQQQEQRGGSNPQDPDDVNIHIV